MKGGATVWLLAGDEEVEAALERSGHRIVRGEAPPARPRAEVLFADLSKMEGSGDARVGEALRRIPGVTPLMTGVTAAGLAASPPGPALAVLAFGRLAPDRPVELVHEILEERRRVDADPAATGRSLILDIPSSMPLVEPIVGFVIRESRAAGFPEAPLVSAVPLCLTEAIVNAITHGNSESAGLRARVRLRLGASKFWCSVEDEGDGFDPSLVPPPTSPENLLKEHGRGLFLMRHYMDEVTFNSKGNSVTLVKRA